MMRTLRCTFLLAALALTGCGESDSALPVAAVAPEHVGSEACGACHAEQYTDWLDSHHRLAIQKATPDTVLAPIPSKHEGLSLTAADDGLVANMTAGDADAAQYRLAYTFGVAPLQQYLVETQPGRFQTLRETWDVPAQRWYHQYEGEVISEDDVLHWTGIAQNWNSMCADCHSTGFRKNYDEEQEIFASNFEELSVGCEACHGPGSSHANDPSLPTPGSTSLTNPQTQPDICAQCHSRRTQLREGFTPGLHLHDFYVPELLNPPLYQMDGQIDDEVYVYGSFKSSKMHAAGVTCGDCHNAHSGELRLGANETCAQCHNPQGNPRFATLPLQDYASPSHHLHTAEVEIACIDCHMPSKVYMGIDERHDHSFRIPRPDLSATTGVTNPCQACHDEDAGQLAAALAEIHGPPAPTWVDALAGNNPDALSDVANNERLNDIVRATALVRLASDATVASQQATENASREAGIELRLAALANLNVLSPPRQIGLVRRSLEAPELSVRALAAQRAFEVLDADARARLEPHLSSALAEYVETQKLHLERPEALVNLANLYGATERWSDAESMLQKAIELRPQFVPARLNYAELLRVQGKDALGREHLEAVVAIEPAIAEAHYAYALWLVRNGSRELSLIHLQTAHLAEPHVPQWAYAYAIALHSLGQGHNAHLLLNKLSTHPVYTVQLQYLHATILRDLSIPQTAEQTALREHGLRLVDELLTLAPTNRNYAALKDALEATR